MCLAVSGVASNQYIDIPTSGLPSVALVSDIGVGMSSGVFTFDSYP